MGMCVQKIKSIVLLAVLACLCGCGPMDSILPSTGTYRINININDVTLNELSFFHSNDKLRPFFEESVSDDPDVTALVVFLRNPRGNTVGWKVTYLIEQTVTEKRDESDNLSPVTPNPQGSSQSGTQSNTQSSTQNGTQSNTQSGTQSNTQSSTQGSTQSGTQSSTQNSTQGSTQSNTQGSTQSGTQSNTQSSTQGSTQSGTQSSTQSNTQSNTQNSTQGSTQSGTQSNTQGNTQSSTQSNAQNSTQSSSTQSSGTQSSTQSGTQSNTQSSTQGSTQSGTQSSTQSNTQGSTQSGTQSSTQSGTQSNTQSSTQGSTQSGTQSSTQSNTQSGTQSNTQSGTQSSTQSNTQSNTRSGTQNSTQGSTQSNAQNSTQSGTQSSTQSNTQSRGSSQVTPISTQGQGSIQADLLEDTERELTEEDPAGNKLLSDEEEDLAAVVNENENIQNIYKDGDELIIVVKSLDGVLPVFPLPNDLPVGRYTLVSHVMSGKNILQRIEKSIYYMGKTVFSYDGIQVHLPGVAESSQVIPKGMVVMLETVLDFDSRLDPYIIWYNGRRKIGEGYFSDGAGFLLWKAPEQSGFFSLRAEVFPVDNHNGLSGYQKDISLLVSSKAIDVNFISEDIPQLLHWYTFEGNLDDSKMVSSAEWALKTDVKNKPKWAGVSGTYGLLVGSQDVFSLPNVLITNDGTEIWQMLFRFNPLNDGVILSVRFINYSDIFINLKAEDHNLVLELVSPTETFSQIHALPEQDSFIKAGVVFSILPAMLSANINIMGDYIINSEVDLEQAGIAAEIEGEFQILLGYKLQSSGETEAGRKREFAAIWDEFALYFMPPQEIFDAYIIEETDEELPQDDEPLED